MTLFKGQILKFTVQQIMESVCKLPGRRLFALEFCNHFHIPHFVCSNTEFGWRFGDWTTCSASCGNRGTWLRRLDCVTPDGKIVPTTKCQHIQKPVTSAVPCNRQDCPPRWVPAAIRQKCQRKFTHFLHLKPVRLVMSLIWNFVNVDFRWLVSDWSKCSTSCGSGWKQRQVSCQQLDARGAEKNLTAASCERMSRPADTEQCSANNCPSWVISPWGKVTMANP